MRTITLCATFIHTLFLFGQTSETDHAKLIQKELGGQLEVTVYSGRVDLVTSTRAWEIDWANKWKESIGQALWYGLQTSKKPGIILIMRKDSDFKYVQQLESALRYAELSDAIEVKVYPSDFKRASATD